VNKQTAYFMTRTFNTNGDEVGMTHDEIIELANAAGLRVTSASDPIDVRRVYWRNKNTDITFGELIDAQQAAIERFAALVAAAEREACAKVCESLKPTMKSYDHRFWDACHESASAIRARGQA
jgi:hypothetical protein